MKYKLGDIVVDHFINEYLYIMGYQHRGYIYTNLSHELFFIYTVTEYYANRNCSLVTDIFTEKDMK